MARLQLLLRLTLAIRVHHIGATQPRLQREHCQNREGSETQLRIAQRRPRQRPQNHEGGQRHVETIHFKSLVHREGVEPSYLRGGADLQSAGFNHSPTCAELHNRPALPADPALVTDVHTPVRKIVRTDSAKVPTCKVKNRNARDDAIARKHHTWKIPLWSA